MYLEVTKNNNNSNNNKNDILDKSCWAMAEDVSWLWCTEVQVDVLLSGACGFTCVSACLDMLWGIKRPNNYNICRWFIYKMWVDMTVLGTGPSSYAHAIGPGYCAMAENVCWLWCTEVQVDVLQSGTGCFTCVSACLDMCWRISWKVNHSISR